MDNKLAAEIKEEIRGECKELHRKYLKGLYLQEQVQVNKFDETKKEIEKLLSMEELEIIKYWSERLNHDYKREGFSND